MTVNEGSSGNAIAYSHSGGETTSDSFKFTVSDGAGGSIAETTFAITVSPNAASQAANIQVTGTAAFGLMLTGSYDYSDAEGNLEGTYSFRWYRADDASGTGQAAIPGASLKSYTPQAADVGKCLCFEVTSAAAAGTSLGAAVKSAWTAKVQKADRETNPVLAPCFSP